MKKGIIYGLLIGGALLMPVERANVGKLIPVEVVCLRTQGDTVILETDTGEQGAGGTVEAAYEDMEDTAAGIIYLDTAKYLLVQKPDHMHLESVCKYLKGDVRVCCVEQKVNLSEAARYLSVNEPEARLNEVTDEKKLEILSIENGVMRMEK